MKTFGLALVLCLGWGAFSPRIAEAQECMTCSQCIGSAHRIDDFPDQGDYEAAEEHGCAWGGDCGTHHEDCWHDEDDAQLILRLHTLSIDMLESLIERNPDKVVLNERRGAVQVRDCLGTDVIIAHFELPKDVVQALAALIQD